MDLSGSWGYIEAIADVRREHNQTQWHIHKHYLEVIGAAGELAARRFLGLPETLHTGFDHGHDFELGRYFIDVKATKLTIHHRWLQWPVGKPIKADIIFLMGVNLDRRIAIPFGYTWASELSKAPVNKNRDIACRELAISALHPAWELRILLRQSQKEPRIEARSRERYGGMEASA